jgi:drug/metabolite transporter (DMT)-like permease
MPSSTGLGIALSLATAILWALSPMFMASVGRRIGSHPTNLLRLLIAGTFFMAVLLPLYVVLQRRGSVPAPTAAHWRWLILSGLVGMVAGDACFYEALVHLGPRRAIKVNTLAPVVALAVGWTWQNEVLTGRALVGAGLVLAAVAYTAFTDAARTAAQPHPPENPPPAPAPQPQHTTAERLVLSYETVAADPAAPPARAEPGRMSPVGLAFGVGSAVCIALGAVFARRAYLAPANDGRPLDPIVATVVRVGTAALIFWLLPLLTGSARRTVAHLANRAVRPRVLIGTALGAIAGMLCYLAALRHAPAGLVSTLVSTSTLIVIPLTALRYGTRIPWDVTLAAMIAVVGVGMISWK